MIRTLFLVGGLLSKRQNAGRQQHRFRLRGMGGGDWGGPGAQYAGEMRLFD